MFQITSIPHNKYVTAQRTRALRAVNPREFGWQTFSLSYKPLNNFYSNKFWHSVMKQLVKSYTLHFILMTHAPPSPFSLDQT